MSQEPENLKSEINLGLRQGVVQLQLALRRVSHANALPALEHPDPLE